MGPAVTVPAVADFLRSNNDVHFLLVGLTDAIAEQLLKRRIALNDPRISIVTASQCIAMDDTVETALRKKKDSSMRVALSLVKEEKAQACISAGNTGALMAVSRYVLKTMTGVERPAIAAVLPNQRGNYTTVLDLGANVDCSAHHLLQFAEMGHALVSTLERKAAPSIGLLNVGEENIKGSAVVKQAAELLKASTLNFYGNVEGDDIYKGTTDIVVCDGFVGNILLKASEGLVKTLAYFIKEEFNASWFSRLAAVVALPVMMRFKKRIDPRAYNGAALLGLRGLVIKSHGSADVHSFECAIRRAYEAVRNGLQERLMQAMESKSFVATSEHE